MVPAVEHHKWLNSAIYDELVHGHVHDKTRRRVVELIDETSSSRVELEGERLPGFHVSDVIDALQS